MFRRLLILFIATPVVELALFIMIGGRIGVGPTVGIILLTAVLGAWLTKWQGLRVLEGIRADLARGQLPHAALVDGLLILFAGALLITPGFLTDTVGFLILVPPFRARLRPLLARALLGRVIVAGAGRKPNGDAPLRSHGRKGVIDVEAEVVDEERLSR